MKERSEPKWIKHYLSITQIFWIPARLPEHVRLFFCFTAKDFLRGMMPRLVLESQNLSGYTYIMSGVGQMALIKNLKKEGGIQNRRMCILREKYNPMFAACQESIWQ